MGSRSTASDLDTGAFWVPARAWLVALTFIGLAGVVMLVTPGPVATGCLDAKGCNVVPHEALWFGVAMLVVGSALSTWIGRVPPAAVIGWSATTAAISSVLLISAPLVLAAPDEVRTWAVAGVLSFLLFGILQTPVALLVSLLPSPFAPRLASTPILHDARPAWLREVTSALEAIESRPRRGLTAAETQLVAQLVFTLEGDPSVPSAVTHSAARLRSLLARDGEGLRAGVLEALRVAAAVVPSADRYRDG